MRALFDVNALIALIDNNHIFHEKAHSWWVKNRSAGWASCPITENGLVRIMSRPSYSKITQFASTEVITWLVTFQEQTSHEFWPADISLSDNKLFAKDGTLTFAQITDSYLLALASEKNGRLVTFDQRISLANVRLATPDNLVVLR